MTVTTGFAAAPRYIDKFGGFPFTLEEDFIYHSERFGTIIVPAGFETDLASIPRGLWNILPKVGPWNWAAIVHDFLYKKAPFIESLGRRINRGEADFVIREAMGAANGPTVDDKHRRLIYWGVRLGGRRGWAKSREHDE